MDTENRIRFLVNYLNKYLKEYEEGQSSISDADWDDAYFELKELEKKRGFADSDSPTQFVGFVTSKLKKVTHNHHMASLDKTKDWDEFVQYFKDKDAACMVKLDGLTVSLRYNHGVLKSAETRGNGLEGEDILHNARVLKSIPKAIGYKDELIIDGEVLCTYQNFKPFEDKFSNPRNFAAGSIRLLNPMICAERNLTFVAWNIVKGLEGNSFIQKLEQLSYLGFLVVPWTSAICKDAADFLKQEAQELGYPIDGLVGRFDNIEYGESLGETSHHSRAAYAFKFYDEAFETHLLNIEWSGGRTGQLCPVAVFEPIDTGDSIIERASLHNVNTLKEFLGAYPYKGQKIYVAKMNMIIPQIVSADHGDAPSENTLPMPEVCPYCGEPVTVQESDSGTKLLVCANPQCSSRLINRHDHFCGIKGLNIKGLSKATLGKLIDWHWVNDLSDIFELQKYKEDWIQQAGFGSKSVNNILDTIEASKNTTLDAFIASLGIPLIGSTVAKDLAKHISSFDELVEKANAHFDFSVYDGFADSKTEALWNYDFTEAKKIYGYLNIKEPAAAPIANGQKIVITGSLESFKNRNEFKKFAEEKGFKVVDSVSKNTTYLINNDINSTSGKNKTAKKLGVPIITEKNFLELF
jgi:DNA ligase (NAD+)